MQENTDKGEVVVHQPDRLTGAQKYRLAQIQEKNRILNSPVPTEKYTMKIMPDKKVHIFDGANRVRGIFAMNPSLRQNFGGRMEIKVKAKIIDGQFEMIKIL